MSQESSSKNAHSCDVCRQKKIQCDRTPPPCGPCRKSGHNCSYISTNTRYSVSREKSCTQCRRRRTRCDRGSPCKNCHKSGYNCVYQKPGSEQYKSPPGVVSREIQPAGVSRNNVEHISIGDVETQDSYPSTLLGCSPVSVELRSLHPPVVQIWELWHLFTENIDPLLKIFHAPSFHRNLLRAVQDLDSIDPEVETVLFSIYFAVTVGMLRDGECPESLKATRLKSLERYRYGLETCLQRSNFLAVPSLASLQAFVLYITIARHSPLAAPVGSLLALAIKLAKSLGLHEGKTETPQPPFRFTTLAQKTEMEMRRRLWWQLITLDVQLAEDTGMDPMIWEGMWDIQMPTNFDDIELNASSELPLPPRAGETFDLDTHMIQNLEDSLRPAAIHDRRTDMTFALLHIDIKYATRQCAFSKYFCEANGYEYLSTSAAKIQFLDGLLREIDRKYLQFCNRNDMFSFFERNSAKLMMSRHVMTAKKDGPAKETLHNSVHVLEAATTMRLTHNKWAWLLRPDVELESLATLWECLGQLSMPTEQASNLESDELYNGDLRLAWLLGEKSFQRGEEHELEHCYGEKWSRIERLHRYAIEKHQPA